MTTWKQPLHFLLQVGGVAFSPDGGRVALVSGQQVQVRDARTSALLWDAGADSHTLAAVAWSPDGNTIATGGGRQTVQIWQAASGQVLRVLRGHTGAVLSLSFAPDGRCLASGGRDGRVLLWDLVQPSPLPRLAFEEHGEAVQSVAFSPEGERLASSSRNAALVWEAESGRIVKTVSRGRHDPPRPETEFGAVAWSPTGLRLALAVGTEVQVFAAFPVSEEARYASSYTYKGHANRVAVVAWCPDGVSVASGGGDLSVHVWYADSPQGSTAFPGNYALHHGSTHALAWVSDGRRLCTAGGVVGDYTLRVWSPTSWFLLRNVVGRLV
jgi:WD40 repeat protein